MVGIHLIHFAIFSNFWFHISTKCPDLSLCLTICWSDVLLFLFGNCSPTLSNSKTRCSFKNSCKSELENSFIPLKANTYAHTRTDTRTLIIRTTGEGSLFRFFYSIWGREITINGLLQHNFFEGTIMGRTERSGVEFRITHKFLFILQFYSGGEKINFLKHISANFYILFRKIDQ